VDADLKFARPMAVSSGTGELAVADWDVVIRVQEQSGIVPRSQTVREEQEDPTGLSPLLFSHFSSNR
jgi:hypothetical protein